MWSNKFIGIPYKLHGRTKEGLDCWGLVRLIYLEQFNIELPSFAESYTSAHDRTYLSNLIASNTEGWSKTDSPYEGAVCLFNIAGQPSHVGIAIDTATFIHVSSSTGTSTIERFNSPKWNKRFVGCYKYVSSAKVTAVPHPLQTKRVEITLTSGNTLAEVYNSIVREFEVNEKLKATTYIYVNGVPIPEGDWATYTVSAGDEITYRALPQDGDGLMRAVLMIAVIYVAANYGADLGSLLLPSATAATQAAFGTAVISMTGMALVNVIAPILPPPQPQDPGSANQAYLFNGSANPASPRSPIPFVLGKVRMTPPIGAQTFVDFVSSETISAVGGYKDSFLNMLLVWGYGPLYVDESTLRIGQSSIDDYNSWEQETLYGEVSESPIEVANFNKLYGTDTEFHLKQLTLTATGNPPVAGTSKTTYETDSEGHPTNIVSGESFSAPWTPSLILGEWAPSTVFSSLNEKFVVAINFPQGLRAIADTTGSSSAAPVGFEVSIKYDSDLDWRAPVKFVVGGALDENNYILDGSYAKDAFTATRTFSLDTTLGKASVRVRRVTGDSTEVGGYRFLTTAVLYSVTGYRNAKPTVNPTNCGIAKTALVIKATDQTNGQLEGVNAIVQTIALSWDSNTLTWVSRPTNNPADLFRAILQHPANPRPVLDKDLDLVALQDWAEFCNLKGYTYNAIVSESNSSVYSNLVKVAAAGRASPSFYNNKWSVVVDTEKNTIVQHFTPHNSWGFESTKAIPRLPDAIRVEIPDEDNDYQTKEIIVPYSEHTIDSAVLFESIDLPGVTNTEHAIDLIRWHMAQAKWRPERYTLNTDFEYLVCTRGDLVKATHDVPLWGSASGRICDTVGNTTNKLLLTNEPLPIEASKTYSIRTRSIHNDEPVSVYLPVVTSFVVTSLSKTNNVITLTLANPYHPISIGDTINLQVPDLGVEDLSENGVYVQQVSGNVVTLLSSTAIVTPVSATFSTNYCIVSLTTNNYYKVLVTGTSDNIAAIAIDDLFLFGETYKESQDLIVLGIEPSSNNTAKLHLMDHGVYLDSLNPENSYNIFTDYLNDTGPAYNSNITLRPENLISSFGSLVPAIKPTDIVSDEAAMEVLSVGVYRFNLMVPFTNDLQLPKEVVSVEGQIDEAYLPIGYDLNDPSTWNTSDIGVRRVIEPVSKGSITFTDVQELEYYKVRLRYVASSGKTSKWTPWYTHKVVGRSTKPSNVQNTRASIVKLGGKILLEWDPNLEKDLYGYEVRSEDIGWGTNTSEKLYLGTSNFIEVPAINVVGDNTWYVKAVDTAGNYSDLATLIVIDIPKMLSVSPSEVSYVFVDTSLTAATITLSWPAPTDAAYLEYFSIKGYRIRYLDGLVERTEFTNSSSITLAANWVGERVFYISVVDIRDAYSDEVPFSVNKSPPNKVAALASQVLDNSVLLSWEFGSTTSLPISHASIYRALVTSENPAPTFAQAEPYGIKSGTFTSFNEAVKGTYVYFVTVVDTDGKESEPETVTVKVNQPADYVLYSKYDYVANNDQVTYIDDTNVSINPVTKHMVLSVDESKTWQQYFTDNGYTNINSAVQDGIVYYAESNSSTIPIIVLQFDYGTIVNTSQISLEYDLRAFIENSSNLITKIGYTSDLGTPFVYQSATSVLGKSFRYVRVIFTLDAIKPIEGPPLYSIDNFILKLDTKAKRDLGSFEYTPSVEAAASGVIVNFDTEKVFADVQSIVLTPALSSSNTVKTVLPMYAFLDYVLQVEYTISTNVVSIVNTSTSEVPDLTENLSPGMHISLSSVTNSEISGLFNILTVSATTITAEPISGTVPDTPSTEIGFVYPNGMKVYLINTSTNEFISVGTPYTISWSVQGL